MEEEDIVVSPDDRFGEEVWFNIHMDLVLGRIVYAFLSGSNVVYYHIRSEDGQYWHRHDKEFKTRKKT